MALYWEHLKGFNGENNGGTPQNVFSIIEWSRKSLTPSSSGYITSADMPKLALLTSNPPQGNVFQHDNNTGKLIDALKEGLDGYVCGSLVATNIINTFNCINYFQGITYFNNNNYFNKKNYFANNIYLTGGYSIYFSSSDIASRIYEGTSTPYPLIIQGRGGIRFFTRQSESLTTLGWWGYSTCPNGLILGSTSSNTSTNIESGYFLQVRDYVKINNYCQALYFNATSDKRAKENFNKLNSGFLDIVKKVQIYSFNYKIDETQRTIGLIAQELQDIDIDGFSLVENKNATGEDGDFMMIRESKLIYVLLGAVQELTKEVEELKKRLEE